MSALCVSTSRWIAIKLMVDRSAESQTVVEMRKQISALFEEQRRDIQM